MNYFSELKKFIYSIIEGMKSIHIFNEYNEFDFIHGEPENKNIPYFGYLFGHRLQSA
jgi:hypothetical protein